MERQRDALQRVV